MEEVLMRSPKRLSLTLGLAALAGCPDPQGQFDAFGERYAAIHDQGGAATGGGGSAECSAPAVGEADGKYLFTLSANLSPEKAFALDVTMVTKEGADGLLLDLELQPLSKDDQKTPVGDPLVYSDLEVAADGSFDWDLGAVVTLIGAANPVTGADVETSLGIQGDLCSNSPDFVCGSATGIVTKPLNMFDLAGSTFTFQKYEGTIPSPLLNCAKDPAVY